jgi:hypothetical protein
MQRRQPLHALGQSPAGQPAAALVDELDVVMGLGPVIPDEQHRQWPPSGSASLVRTLEEKTVAT